MSELIQFGYDFEKYNHIDPPTRQNMELWDKTKPGGRLWQLLKPVVTFDPTIWKNPAVALLAQYNFPFEYSRKIDGTNVRVHWDGERLTYAGKNDKNPEESGFKGIEDYMRANFLEEAFEEKFGREISVSLYGEFMGPKVQLNELKLDEMELVLFDVKINRTWLLTKDMAEIASYFKLRTAFDFMGEDKSTEKVATEGNPNVGNLNTLIQSCSAGDFRDWEGIVAKPVGGFLDRIGRRIIIKIKNHDYFESA